MPLRDPAATVKEPEPPRQQLDQIGWSHRSHPGRGQLERERQSIEAPADLGHLRQRCRRRERSYDSEPVPARRTVERPALRAASGRPTPAPPRARAGPGWWRAAPPLGNPGARPRPASPHRRSRVRSCPGPAGGADHSGVRRPGRSAARPSAAATGGRSRPRPSPRRSPLRSPSSTMTSPSAKRVRSRLAASRARLVLPTPPGPVSVTSRPAWVASSSSPNSSSRPSSAPTLDPWRRLSGRARLAGARLNVHAQVGILTEHLGLQTLHLRRRVEPELFDQPLPIGARHRQAHPPVDPSGSARSSAGDVVAPAAAPGPQATRVARLPPRGCREATWPRCGPPRFRGAALPGARPPGARSPRRRTRRTRVPARVRAPP